MVSTKLKSNRNRKQKKKQKNKRKLRNIKKKKKRRKLELIFFSIEILEEPKKIKFNREKLICGSYRQLGTVIE